MKEGIASRLAATFALVGVGLALASAAAFRSSRHLEGATGMVAHTHEVLATLAEVSLRMTETQSATRGFVITGDEDYLLPYLSAEADILALLDRLRHLTADNPSQHQRLTGLGQLVHGQLEYRSGLVRLVRERGTETGMRELSTGKGAREMDAVRGSIAEIRESEEALLKSRQDQSKTASRASFRTWAGLTALVFVVLALGGVLLRRSLLQQLQAEAERDRFFTASLDMLCIAGADGYFKRLSPAFTRTLGWSIEEMMSRPLLDFVHPDDREATLKEVERQLVGGEQVLQFENRYLHKDGGFRLLSWKSVPEAGHRMYATARDVTDRRLAEEAIKSLNAEMRTQATQLQAANQELESFAYSVSHDLRSPLRAIDGFSQALIEDYSERLDAVGVGYLRRVRDAAQRMGHLIDDLLNLSRVSRSDMAVERVNLGSLARRVVSDLQPEGLGRKVQWDIGESLFASGDPRLLHIVLENLLGNALKFTSRVEVARIVFDREQDGAEEIFAVRDNGAGFEMAHADRLFGAFQRLHTAREFPGTGIGLATVQRVIHRHGGRIWAESSPGQGATFRFTLGAPAPLT